MKIKFSHSCFAENLDKIKKAGKILFPAFFYIFAMRINLTYGNYKKFQPK